MDTTGDLFSEYGISSFPTTFMIDREGNVFGYVSDVYKRQLRENDLEVLEEVCPLSARMIVNPVSMRMENERIKELLTKLRMILQEA